MKVQGRKKFVSRWYAVQGAWVAPETRATLQVLPRQFGRSCSNGWCVIMEILRKMFVSPFTAIRGHWNRPGSIGYL